MINKILKSIKIFNLSLNNKNWSLLNLEVYLKDFL
jgi:hypothetical protein